MRTANPYDNAHAVALSNAWVKARTKVVPGLCDHYAALLFGWGASGSVTALAHYQAIPASYRLPGPVTGCLAFYADPRGRGDGHVAIVDASHDPDNIVIGTTDLPDPGLYTHQLVTAPTKAWGLRLLGYTRPLFPNGLDPAHTPLYRV